MFLDLFYELRSAGVPVGMQEWMTLMEALGKGLHGSSLLRFYHLSRACLVKSETYFDAFDRVFARVFEGIEGSLPITEEEAALLSHEERKNGWRLACRARADAPVSLQVEQFEAPVLVDHTTFDFEPRPGCGLAVDLGTTTLAGSSSAPVKKRRVTIGPMMTSAAASRSMSGGSSRRETARSSR